MISILSNFVNEVAHILKYQVVHSYKGIEKLKGTWAVTSKFNATVQSGSNIKTQWPKWCRQPFRNGLIIVASLSWLSRLFPDWKFILHKLRRFPRILIKFLKYFIKMSSYHHIISAIIWHLTTPSYKKIILPGVYLWHFVEKHFVVTLANTNHCFSISIWPTSKSS